MSDWQEMANAAPPALLRAMRSVDAQEVLILSYTCDLSFIEDVCLPQTRTMRARTTILYDVDQLVAPSALAMPGDYFAIPVTCRNGAAFHPKLVVIASANDAIISIGSGNATTSGWHHNAEIWTHLRADGPTVPRLIHDLADWLERLPNTIWVEDAGRDSLQRVATLLRERPAEPHPGEPQLLTSDRAPFLTQIPRPSNPVSELAVASPFFDSKADALTRLCEKLEPEAVTLLVTKDVRCDPKALNAVLSRGRHMVRTPEARNRYHHGKIIEWHSGDIWWILTGSANCTRSALLDSASGRGNCELGLLSTGPASIVHNTPSIDTPRWEHLQMASPPFEPKDPADVTVLGVRLHGGQATAHLLVRRGGPPLYLQIGDLRLDHDRADGPLHTYTAALPEADRTNLSGTTTVTWPGTTGINAASATVTDIDAAHSRIERPSPLEHSPLASIITDPVQLAALHQALEHLATVRPEHILTRHTGEWRRRHINTAVTNAVGPALAGLTLGLGLDDRRAGPTTEDIDEYIENLDADGIEQQPVDTDASPQPPINAARRRQLLRTTQRLLDTAEEWPLPAMLAVTRITLLMAAAGIWPEADDWLPLIHQALVQVWAAETEPSLADEHAALSTIGLLAMHRGITLHDVADVGLRDRFEELRREYSDWRPWLADASDRTLSGYAAQLAGPTFGVSFERSDFRVELEWLLERSALNDAVDELPRARLDQDGAVRIAAPASRKALLAALDALRAFPNTEVVTEGVRMHGWWNGRRLLLVTNFGPGWKAELWLNLATGIAAYAHGGTALRRPDRQWVVADPHEALNADKSS